MKTVTTEVLEHLVYLAALTQKHTPALDPLSVSKALVKMQKLAVTLRGRDGAYFPNELARDDYEQATRGFTEKMKNLAGTININCHRVPFGGIFLTIGDAEERLF